MAKIETEVLQAALDGYAHQRAEILSRMAEIRQRLAGKELAPVAAASAVPGTRRNISAAGRRRIAAAQRARWAAAKKAKEPAVTKAPASGGAKPSAARKSAAAKKPAAKKAPAKRTARKSPAKTPLPEAVIVSPEQSAEPVSDVQS